MPRYDNDEDRKNAVKAAKRKYAKNRYETSKAHREEKKAKALERYYKNK